MDQNINNAQPAKGCSKYFKGCLIITAVMMAAIIGLFIYAMNLPAIQVMLECRDNMTQVGEALERYHSVNSTYPPDLETLKKEYLKDPSVLKCPLDKSGGNKSSYIYHKPPENAADTFVILECDRHSMGHNMPPSKLKLMINGEFKSPSFQEAMDEASKQQK